ncbi:TPA: pentapeptide repeat-containing protein, partial [Listeria monocytogenes]
MNQAELDVVIEKHEKWLRDGYGERANLRGANLSYADLSCANLRGANLSYADLSCANLSGANLSYADLNCANL